MTAIGLDIGGTSVKAALFRGTRCVRVLQSSPYVKPSLDELKTAIASVVGGEKNVAKVGACLPGIVDAKSGKVTHCVNVPALVGARFGEMIRMALRLRRDVRVSLCGDAMATAYDIQRLRRLKGRLLVLTLGTGVGCSVLDDDVPLDVDEGSPGHLGQMDVSVAGHTVIGPDAGRGGLEGYIGAPALIRRHGVGRVEEALARYKGNEPPIQALVRAVRIAHAIYRPQHVVLCGGIGLALRHLVPAIRQQAAHELTRIARSGWTLNCGDDLFHAARGAARIALRR